MAKRVHSARGFSMVEVMSIMAVIVLLAAVATPPLLHWRKELSSGRGARGIYDALRQARSRAMASGFQHEVGFDPVTCSFRVRKGTRAYRTPASGWGTPLQGWVALTDGVTMKSGADGNSSATVNVQFNADGTARLETPGGTAVAPPDTTVTISIQGDPEAKKNKISVATCGRITLQ